MIKKRQMTMTTSLKKTNLRFSRILRHIGSRELPRRSGYYKHTWYGAILKYAILDSSSVAKVCNEIFPGK